MYKQQIIQLLSNHRQTLRPELPETLNLSKIATLIQQSLSPDQSCIKAQVERDLQELQAEGEVLAGKRNRYCMAKPILLTENQNNCTGLLFQGDRAYLKLAHQTLETGQPPHKNPLRPRTHNFDRLKERLKRYGIDLLTPGDTIDDLPEPQLPEPYLLKGSKEFYPLRRPQVYRYSPKLMTPQCDRWETVAIENLTRPSVLRLSTGEYIWFKKGKFYELTPDAALLAMFRIDKDTSIAVSVSWDDDIGRLNLEGIKLPSLYARSLWRLSKPEGQSSRLRLFNPLNRLKAKEILLRLGCTLV